MTANPLLPMEQLLVLLVAIVAGGLLLAWRASVRLPAVARRVALAARATGFLALAAIALNVGHWRKPGADSKPRWCVLVDRSASMATADEDGQTRWEAACRLVSGLESATEGRRELDVFGFSDGVDGARVTEGALRGLKPDGRATDACRVLESVAGAGAVGAVKPIGIVMLSDGRQTAAEPDALMAGLRARAVDAAVIAVPLGRAVEVRDIAVRVGRRMAIGFVGQPVRITGEVVARWPVDLNVEVRLVDDAGRVVGTNAVRVVAGGRANVVFAVTPDRPGYKAYRLQVASWPDETDVRNNESEFEIHAMDRKIRVLLLEGLPYWDSKFLGQHLRKHPNMAVDGVYRTAPDRFFKTDPAGATVAESGSIFPETADALGAYDIVVFGKGAEYFLTAGRLAALKTFAADFGGSVIFARGRPYTGDGAGLEDLEPVEWGAASSVECRFTPRVEGEEVGLFAGLLPGREEGIWAKLPPVRCSRAVAGLKSFSQVLVEGRRTDMGAAAAVQAQPLLVSRRYGKGMTAVMNVDGFWQWSFFPTSKDAASMYEELWTQLLLWVGTYAEFLPGHDYALHLSSPASLPDTPVRVQVRRRSATDANRAAPRLRVTLGAAVVQELELAAGERPDCWEAALALSAPGLYRVTVVPPVGVDPGAAPGVLLQVQAPKGETDDLNPDREFLAKLAEASGGRMVEARSLADAMAQREAQRQVVEQGGGAVWDPLWDRSWLLVLVLAALAVEWVIRRRNGLA